MRSIKNVVFDIGNVLIAYTPNKVIESFTELGDDACKLLFKHIFASKIWIELDRGDLTLAAAVDKISAEIPEYSDYVRRVFEDDCLERMFSEMPGTSGFMRELRRKGYKVYLLSNFSLEGFDYVENRFDFLDEIDGKIISSHVGLIKPMSEIYELLLGRFGLEPSETIFIDDIPENCAGAEAVGIKTIRFTGCDALQKQFMELEGGI